MRTLAFPLCLGLLLTAACSLKITRGRGAEPGAGGTGLSSESAGGSIATEAATSPDAGDSGRSGSRAAALGGNGNDGDRKSQSAAAAGGRSGADAGRAAEGGAGGQAGGTANSPSPSKQWVLGYYVGYQIDSYPISQIDWGGLTHIAFAPLMVKDDLSLDFDFYDAHGTGVADAQALSKAAHAHGVSALLMLGGSDAGAHIAKAAAPAKRAAFVQALLSALDMLGYDGVDLDWEDNVNLDDLIALAKALRQARPSIVLSYPGGAINPNFMTVDPKYVQLAEAVDRFNIQTYYPSTALAGGDWTSWFNSPLGGALGSSPISIEDSLQRYADAGIPRQKLGFGAAFYAICYTGAVTGPRQSTEGSSIVGGDNTFPLSALFTKGSVFDKSSAEERHVDAEAKVPYLSLKSAVSDPVCEGKPSRYISYEDEQSLKEKGRFSRSNGYGGIIIWTIQQGWLPTAAAEDRPQNALMQALKQGFIDP